ncbi:hypothetical protein SOM22_07900 [Stenotrophomonas rhizophila]|uniref:hypothetical protein n=1 Tax=Stenotrophomonas rhizophila TaxID=216778 RepID=UPI002A6B791C|nr:hypothetical protein [Stenotrophomonas rhizophila]MDY0954496.1 hypothetical protein [Stenotrophomonas rhizophila]
MSHWAQALLPNAVRPIDRTVLIECFARMIQLPHISGNRQALRPHRDLATSECRPLSGFVPPQMRGHARVDHQLHRARPHQDALPIQRLVRVRHDASSTTTPREMVHNKSQKKERLYQQKQPPAEPQGFEQVWPSEDGCQDKQHYERADFVHEERPVEEASHFTFSSTTFSNVPTVTSTLLCPALDIAPFTAP